MRYLLVLALLVLGGCATSPDCYVGVSIFPPGPFVHCGVGAEPDEDEEEAEPLNV